MGDSKSWSAKSDTIATLHDRRDSMLLSTGSEPPIEVGDKQIQRAGQGYFEGVSRSKILIREGNLGSLVKRERKKKE